MIARLIQMNTAERKPPMTMHELTDERLAELRTIASNVGLGFDYGCVDDDNTATVAEWMSSCSDDPGAPAAGRLWAVYAPTDEREGLIIGAITGDGENAQHYAEHIAAFDPPTVIALLDEVERLREQLADVEALHQPVDLWEVDPVNGTWLYGKDDERVKIGQLCSACTPDDTLEDVGDRGWSEDNESTFWPCPTVLVARGESR